MRRRNIGLHKSSELVNFLGLILTFLELCKYSFSHVKNYLRKNKEETASIKVKVKTIFHPSNL